MQALTVFLKYMFLFVYFESNKLSRLSGTVNNQVTDMAIKCSHGGTKVGKHCFAI